MTTDKDEARKLVKYAYKAIRFDKAAFVVTDFIPPVEKEIARIRAESYNQGRKDATSDAMGYGISGDECDRIRHESADQARKEAADRNCALCRSVNATQCPLPGECLYRAAILGETVKQGKTDAEKLAIAVKGLEAIREMRWGDSWIVASSTLKEIQ